MAGHPVARVDEGGIAPVRLAQRPAEPLGRRGRQDEMDVVGHQAIAPHRDRLARAGLAKQIAVEFVVGV